MSEGIRQLSAALFTELQTAGGRESRIRQALNLSRCDSSNQRAHVFMQLRSIVRRDFLPRGTRAMLALILVGLAAAPARAVDGDTQLWNTQNFNYKIDDKWSANLEVQERWYDDVSFLTFFIIRPSVTYKWNDWLSFTGGYAHFRVYDQEGDFADEDRIWEQVNVRLFGGKDQPTLNWRTRLEQRMFEAGGDTVWRLREQLRLMVPLVDKVQGVAWTEAFWRLNDGHKRTAGFRKAVSSSGATSLVSTSK